MKPVSTVQEQRACRVAPHAGAWIETYSPFRLIRLLLSPPTRGRGLKRHMLCLCTMSRWSPPTRGRGLKPARSLET